MSGYGSLRRHGAALPLELIMAGGAVVTFSQANWKHLAISLFTLTVSFAPLLAERLYKVKIPMALQFIYVAFIFGSMFSGEVVGMYGRIWPWDDWTHFISGLVVGLGVMMILVQAGRSHKYRVPVRLGSLLIFCTAMTLSALWEIFEFSSDKIFGTFSQGADLHDTMLDLIYGMTSGAIMAWLWILHHKHRRVPVVSFLIAQFERHNIDKAV